MICTVQRMYSILKGEELDEAAEEVSPAEQLTRPKDPLPVVYNPKVPMEFFDFIFIDECHRSIYNLWIRILLIRVRSEPLSRLSKTACLTFSPVAKRFRKH